MKKILVIQLRQLGDVLTVTPLLRQLKKIFPHAKVHFLTEKENIPLLQFNKNIDQILSLRRKSNFFSFFKLIFAIRKEKYNLVIDAFNNPKSAFVTFFSGALSTLSFSSPFRNFMYSKTIPIDSSQPYSPCIKLQLLRDFGVNIQDYQIEFPIDLTNKNFANTFFHQYHLHKNVIVFHVVSRRDYKIWPAAYFAMVGNWLIEQGYFLLFTYAPPEHPLAQKVWELIEQKEKTLIEYPAFTILQIRAILEKCCLYVGNDGGMKHVAVCAKIPTFTLFQNINPENWTPPHSLRDDYLLSCVGNQKLYDEVTDKSRIFSPLEPQHVISALLQFLKRTGLEVGNGKK